MASLVTNCTKLGLLAQLQPNTQKQAMGIKPLRRLVKLTWRYCHMQCKRCCLDSSWEYCRVVALTTITVSVGLTISLLCLTSKSAKSEVIEALFPPLHEHTIERISTEKHSIQSRLVIRPSKIQFAGVCVSTFQLGNFTGWGSEGVSTDHSKDSHDFLYKLKSRWVPVISPYYINTAQD